MATKPKSVRKLKKELSSLTKKAKGVAETAKIQGKDTSQIDAGIARSESMVAQTKKQGSKPYAGSSFENEYLKSDAYKKSLIGTPLISSQMGKSQVIKADQTMDNLAPITSMPTTPVSEGGQTQTGTTTPTVGVTTTPTTTPDVSKDYKTFINEKTGQELTYRGDAITPQAEADALKKGYVLASSEISGQKTTPEMARIQQEYNTATSEVDTFMQRMESMLITDKELRGDIKQISAKYKARQNEMREINERRQVAMETLGIRTGARYTGGSGGIMGGLLSEEERQGLMRIESIENDKQDAIMQAKKAAREQNFTLYTTLAQKAEKIQEKKATELQALKTAQAEQDKKIAEETKKQLVGAVVSDLINKGVTSNNDIYSKLNDPSIAGIIGNVAPKDFKELMDALLPTGTGIIGEYEYYKREAQRMGQTPLSFDEYQTRDANRKRPITNVQMVGDYTDKQIRAITSLNDKISTNDTYKKTSNMKTFADNVKIALSQETGTGDIAAINQFQKVIDEGAVTRDQDVVLIRNAQSLKNRLDTFVTGLSEGDKLSDDLRNEMKTIIEQMYTTQVQALKNDPFIKAKTKEAELNNIDVEDTILSEITAIGTGDKILQDEATAEVALTNWVAQSPENRQRLEELKQILPDATLSEIKEELGL